LVFLFFRASHDGYAYLYRISYMYYIVLGFLVTFLVGLIVSAIFRGANRECAPELFTPFVRNRLKRREKDHTNIALNVSIFVRFLFRPNNSCFIFQ